MSLMPMKKLKIEPSLVQGAVAGFEPAYCRKELTCRVIDGGDPKGATKVESIVAPLQTRPSTTCIDSILWETNVPHGEVVAIM